MSQLFSGSVRDATRKDIDFIVEANHAMAKETEDKGLDLNALRQGVAYLFEHPAEGIYLIAENQQGLAVGTLMVTFEWSEWRNGRFWWIQSVFVQADSRRTGVYSALHERVRQLAQEDAQACGIRLYVERDNINARHTYEQIGMVETPYRLYEELL